MQPEMAWALAVAISILHHVMGPGLFLPVRVRHQLIKRFFLKKFLFTIDF